MRRTILSLLILLLLTSFMTACTVREELQFAVELRDKNLGYTVSDIDVACIVTHPELVDTVDIMLTSPDNTYTSRSTTPQTITEFSLSDLKDGTYTSKCVVCAEDECRESEPGTVLLSLEQESSDVYELDVPPTFILGTPIEGTFFLSDSPLLVSFSCLANDDVGLTAVSLVTNVSGVLSETFIQNPSRSTHLLTKDLVLQPGTYLWTCRATDNRAQTTVAPIRIFTIGAATELVLPKATNFDGKTTNFAELPTLTNVPDVIIEDTEFGQIQFADNISSLVGVDLDKGIIITQNSITVNSTLYPQLNVPARLSFYDIEFDDSIEDLTIERDGNPEGVEDLIYENGTLEFSVGNFSTYTVVITPEGGFNLEEEEAQQEEEEEAEEPTEEIVEEEPVEDIEFEVGESTDENTFLEEQLNQESAQEQAAQESQEEEESSSTGSSSGSSGSSSQESQEEESSSSPQENTEDDTEPVYFDPLVMVLLIGGFVLVVTLVIWLIRRNSRGPILKHY